MISKLRSIRQRVSSGSSLKRLAKAVLRDPQTAWVYFMRSGSRRWIKAVFDSEVEYRKFVEELGASGLLEELKARLSIKFAHLSGVTVRGNPYTPGTMLSSQAADLYALIRKRKPTALVETGVCNGFSSAVILAALQANGTGRLYSIDYPEFTGRPVDDQSFWAGKGGAVVPSGESSGWAVPLALRDRWELRLGKSAELLPLLLDQLGSIDFFVHDSEHSLENQLFEFRIAWQHLSPQGLLVASDINWSRAFETFSNEVAAKARCYFIDHSLALVLAR
jgi:predicted O-methyltransferase YrrM